MYFRTCTGSASVERPPEPQLDRCLHRREVIEIGRCNACGMRGQEFEVYACAIHGKCMIRRYRNDRPDLKVCVNCDGYQPDE
jgi:hypothetical protein